MKNLQYFIVDKDTTLHDLKKQYNNLAKIYHSDKGGHDTIMAKINLEYDKVKKIVNGESLEGCETSQKQSLLNNVLDFIGNENVETLKKVCINIGKRELKKYL